MALTNDYLLVPDDTTIEKVLRSYLERGGKWWWLLITEMDGQYYVCSFGSLLPYLAGRTPHIVHNIGDCAICCSMDPVLWRETDALVEEALASRKIRRRRVSKLPMAKMPIIPSEIEEGLPMEIWLSRQGLRVGGVVEEGVLSGVYVVVYRDGPGGVPEF